MKIFLIGMMGSGKSFWAKKLAKKWKLGGYDLDFLIESNEEKSIAEIFEEDGEAYFRKVETKLLHWFADKKAFFLATGGGAPCFNNNMEWMNKQGITIWINEPVEVLVNRLLPEKEHRPLIRHLSDQELHTFLSNKLAERTAYYQQAKFTLTAENITDKRFQQILQENG